MRSLFVVVLACVNIAGLPAAAQPLFANPLDTSAGYRTARGETSDATDRIRYEVVEQSANGPAEVTELTIDIAPDWALYRKGDSVTLFDFQLNRQFQLEDETFTTLNGMAGLIFRVMERQNRSYLLSVLGAVGAEAEIMSDCDSDSELGLSLPGKTSKSAIAFTEQRGAIVLMCDNKEAGRFVEGSEKAPAAFWPTIFNAMPMHPMLFKRMRDAGAAPQMFEVASGIGPTQTKSTFRLLSVETATTPYRLTDELRNSTVDMFDTLIGPGGGQLAADAIAGTAAGGAPTLESWGTYIESLKQTDPAAASMLFLPSFNMFPELEQLCGQKKHAICSLAASIGALKATEPAPMALIEMGMAEQQGNMSAVIKAMQTIASSRHHDHPAVAGSYALALMKFEPADLDKAKAAGLPTDVKMLQAKALMGLPYNPAYWTDAADPLAMKYRWHEATLFYDVAFALPMPGAIARNGVLAGKRALFEKIRTDFPDAFLPR